MRIGEQCLDSLDDYRALGKEAKEIKGDVAELRKFLRYWAERDLFFFINQILSFGSIRHNQTGEPLYFHDRYIEYCNSKVNQLNIGLGVDWSARATGKTTIGTVGVALWLASKFKNIRIIISSFEKGKASEIFQSLGKEIIQNKTLRWIFDDIYWQGDSKQEIEKAASSSGSKFAISDGIIELQRDHVLRGGTFEIARFDEPPVGSRADVLIGDDIETPVVVGSEANLLAQSRGFEEYSKILQGGRLEKPIIMINNTVVSPMALVYKLSLQYEAVDHRAVVRVPGENLDVNGDGPMGGSPVYPHTPESLEFQYRNCVEDYSSYYTQICCVVGKGHSTSLNPDDIMFFDESSVSRAFGSYGYILIDPSAGKKDNSVIMTVGVRQDGSINVLRCSRRKLDYQQMKFRLESEILWASQHCMKLIEIRVEDCGQSQYYHMAKDVVLDCGGRCGVKSVNRSATQKSKPERIFDSLNPLFGDRRIFFPRRVDDGGRGILDDNGVDLVKYFMTSEVGIFPQSKSFDMMDALCLANEEKLSQLAIPSGMIDSGSESGGRSWQAM